MNPDVIILRETNPHEWIIEEGHHLIGKALDAKAVSVNVQHLDRKGIMSFGKLDLTTYRFTKLEVEKPKPFGWDALLDTEYLKEQSKAGTNGNQGNS